MSQTGFISVHPVVCPRCGKIAELVENDAVVGLTDNEQVARGMSPRQRRDIFSCATCTTPVYGIGQLSERFDPDPEAPGCGVSYKQFTFLSDGTEVF